MRITGISICRGGGLSCVGDKCLAISLGSSRGYALPGNPGTLKMRNTERRNGTQKEEWNMKRGTLERGTLNRRIIKRGIEKSNEKKIRSRGS
jgi:hypothetical protein